MQTSPLSSTVGNHPSSAFQCETGPATVLRQVSISLQEPPTGPPCLQVCPSPTQCFLYPATKMHPGHATFLPNIFQWVSVSLILSPSSSTRQNGPAQLCPLLPVQPHLLPTLLLSSSDKISFSSPNVPSFLSLCPRRCSVWNPVLPSLAWLLPESSAFSIRGATSESFLTRWQLTTCIHQVGLSCVAEAACCAQISFLSFLSIESFFHFV